MRIIFISEPWQPHEHHLLRPVRGVKPTPCFRMAFDAEIHANARLSCTSPACSTPLHRKFEQQGRRLWDSINSPRLLLRPLMKADDCFDHSPLMVGFNRQLAMTINQDIGSARSWLAIFCGREFGFGLTSPCTVLCYVDQQGVRRFTQGEFGTHKSPMVLPGSRGQLGNDALDHTKAQEAWAKLVTKASAGWHTVSTTIPVDQHGARILSGLKTYTESIRAAGKYPQRYTWVLSTCVAVAAVDHGIRKDGCEIHPDSWEFALSLTRWAVDAHTEFFRRVGRACPCPPQAEDENRILARIQNTPTIKFWQLLRALPRRPQGYWKKLYAIVTTRRRNGRMTTSSDSATGVSCDPKNSSDPRDQVSASRDSGDFGNVSVNADPFS